MKLLPLLAVGFLPPAVETPGLRETPDHKDPQARRVLKASRVSRVFRVLPVLKAPRDLRARPVRRVTKERKAKLQP
jgi:hypothetical protein